MQVRHLILRKISYLLDLGRSWWWVCVLSWSWWRRCLESRNHRFGLPASSMCSHGYVHDYVQCLLKLPYFLVVWTVGCTLCFVARSVVGTWHLYFLECGGCYHQKVPKTQHYSFLPRRCNRCLGGRSSNYKRNALDAAC